MSRRSFDTWRRQATAAGQRQLADSIRMLVYRADEALFDRLDFAEDAQFLHPLLFALFTDPAPCIGLPQALYGLMPADRRPERVRIDTDTAGRAFLGACGVIATAQAATELHFVRRDAQACTVMRADGAPVPFRLHAPLVLPGTQVEVTTQMHPLFTRFMEQPVEDTPGLEVAPDRLCPLLQALALLRAHCPAVWAEVAAVTRVITLYHAPAPNSFAALSAHGAIFCNVQPGDGEIALLEDVTHQAAHVLFNALSHDPARFLAIDPQTPIRDLSSEAGETRSLYEAVHGLFTYTLICRVLAGVVDSRTLPEVQAHEALGRLGFTLRKFTADLERLRLPAAYTQAGQRCYDAFAADHAAVQARYGSVVQFDYGNQEYVFDYARFVARNGGPFPAECLVAA